MEITKRKFALIIGVVAILCVCIAVPFSIYVYRHYLNVHGKIGFSFTRYSIHTQTRIYRGSELILDEYHSGVVTNLGDNMTLYKLWGDSDFQYGSLNTTALAPFISIGNYTGGNLNTSSTVLPDEWHREVATIDGETQSQLNFSCTISGGDISGTQKADCVGICLTETDDANDLWGYDTFTESSGIDNTHTITVDIQVSVSHS